MHPFVWARVTRNRLNGTCASDARQVLGNQPEPGPRFSLNYGLNDSGISCASAANSVAAAGSAAAAAPAACIANNIMF